MGFSYPAGWYTPQWPLPPLLHCSGLTIASAGSELCTGSRLGALFLLSMLPAAGRPHDLCVHKSRCSTCNLHPLLGYYCFTPSSKSRCALAPAQRFYAPGLWLQDDPTIFAWDLMNEPRCDCFPHAIDPSNLGALPLGCQPQCADNVTVSS